MQLTRSIKVATWNIHSGMNQAGTYIDLTKDSRSLLANGGYDVVGLQEVRVNYSASNPNSKYPINALTSGTIQHGVFYKALSLTDEPTADFGNGVLSRHSLSNFTQYTLPNTVGAEARILTQADITVDGKKIYLFVTHLRFDDDAIRAFQMQFIKDKLDALNGQSFVLFGDFNIKSTSEFDIFLPTYKIGNGNGGVYFDTYNLTDWPTKKLDNIICSADFTVSSPAVVSTKLSDHSLFYTQLEWTETVPDPVAPTIVTDVAKGADLLNNKSSLVHILDRKTDEIVGTLNADKKEYWGAIRHDSLNAENTFDFVANASLKKSELLENRNRLLIQDEDGLFREYIINYAEQYRRNEKAVKSDASFVDIAKAKVIEPQELTGTTAILGVIFALSGTEWKPGNIEFTGTQTIKIENYTNPLELIKTITETFSLELSFRVEVNGNKVIGRYVDMGSQIAGFNGKEITFGKDLMGVKRKEDSSKIITALYGIHEKSDGTKLTVWVQDDEAFQRWGRNDRALVDWYQPDSSDEEMTFEKLITLTETELKKRIDAVVSYECDAVSLEHIFGREHEKIRIGQTVRIKDDGYNPSLYLEARIQEVDVDQATKRIQSFKIFNFIEYSKADLEKQIATLKQQMVSKAARVILGNDGETVINLDEGGFSEINVGKVISSSVPNFNDEDLNFYVDPVAGDNNNDGLSWATAKLTIQACLDDIPKVNNGTVTITCKAPQSGIRQDFIGNVILEGYTGSGSITVEGVSWYNYINGRIQVSGCTNSIFIDNFTVNLTEVTKVAVEVLSSNNVSFDKIWVYGQTTIAAFSVSNGSRANISNCEGYDCTYIILCNYSSTVCIINCKGLGNIRGIVAQYGGWITVDGTYPGGATSNTYNDTGGSISLNGATANNGAKGTVPTQLFTKQWVSNIADNWSSSYSSWQGGGAKQGDYGYGQRKGFWWFESNPIVLSGKTIKSMRVWVQRASSGGNSGKTRIYLHPHTYGTKGATPTNPSLALETTYDVFVDLSWGEGAWVNIPSTWFSGFASGSYKGIGIWAGSTSRSYYSIMQGQAWVEATYQ